MVSQKAVRRRLIKASGDISELGFDESTTTQELLEKAETELFSVSDQSLKQDLVSLESILTDSFDRIEDLYKNKGSLRGKNSGKFFYIRIYIAVQFGAEHNQYLIF
jgi:replicative DNA helicase